MKGENSRAAWSGRMSDSGIGDGETNGRYALALALEFASSVTSPRSVNLMALPARLVSTWRRRCASPRRSGGIPGDMARMETQTFRARLHSQQLDHIVHGSARIEAQFLQRDLARLDLRKVQDVVDQGQQCPPAVLRDSRRIAAVPSQIAFPAAVGACPGRRSSACGSRGSCWPESGSWPDWRRRRPPGPESDPPRSVSLR